MLIKLMQVCKCVMEQDYILNVNHAVISSHKTQSHALLKLLESKLVKNNRKESGFHLQEWQAWQKSDQ